MNNNPIYSDSLSELKEGMRVLKESLPASGAINDGEIRAVMQKKSTWLKSFVWSEIIGLPLAILILLGAAAVMHLNPWCIYALAIVGLPGLILDWRTMTVPQKWIQTDSLVELSRKLAKQKLWRKRQTLWEAPLGAAWCAWFMYEYLRNLDSLAPGSGIGIPEEYFFWAWGILSALMICVVAAIVIYIYRKAQRINDEMIRNIDSFTEA